MYFKNDTINNTSDLKKDFKNLKKYFEKTLNIKFKTENVWDEKTSKNFSYAWEDDKIKIVLQSTENKFANNKKTCAVSIGYFIKDAK